MGPLVLSYLAHINEVEDQNCKILLLISIISFLYSKANVIAVKIFIIAYYGVSG